MKNNKGLSLIPLILIIVLLVAIVYDVSVIGIRMLLKLQLEDLKTDMLLIQSKAKTYSESVSVQAVNLDESKEEDSEKIREVENTNLVGTKLSACSEEIQLKAQNAGVTELDQYYCLTKEDLQTMEIDIKIKKGEYYLVKYNLEDTEIVYTKGFKYEGAVYYKLTDLTNISN